MFRLVSTNLTRSCSRSAFTVESQSVKSFSSLAKTQARQFKNTNNNGIQRRWVAESANTTTTAPAQPDRLHGSIHWNYERLLSAALLPVTGFAFFYGAQPINDMALAVLLPLHSHLGIGVIITDYIPKRKFPVANNVATWGLRLLTAGVVLACWKLNTSDVGITETVKRVWHAKKDKKEQ